MKSVTFEIPYPISVNKMYYNRQRNYGIESNFGYVGRGRGLTSAAKKYKVNVANLIHYSHPYNKFNDEEVKVTIIDHGSNKRRDKDNGLKIVFDAIELSGLINNDRQIKSFELKQGESKSPPTWFIKVETYVP